MKTAEEWVMNEDTVIPDFQYTKEKKATSLSSLTFSYESEHSAENLMEFVKQIQLDAWKQGMTDAADICNGTMITIVLLLVVLGWLSGLQKEPFNLVQIVLVIIILILISQQQIKQIK
jgi:hypothetical protein